MFSSSNMGHTGLVAIEVSGIIFLLYRYQVYLYKTGIQLDQVYAYNTGIWYILTI